MKRSSVRNWFKGKEDNRHKDISDDIAEVGLHMCVCVYTYI